MGMRTFLVGLGLGIGLASALIADDRRRVTLRDRGLRLVDALDDLPAHAEGLGRRVRAGARDLAFEAWSRLQDGPVSDEVLAARVRAVVTRVALRPGYLAVIVDRGSVIIRGWASPDEFERLVDVVKDVKGVERVSAQLDAFGTPEAGPPTSEDRDVDVRNTSRTP